ncbi:MAG: DUF3169 family protein [Lachnospiraceae bacterium]|nr:DUF3169 family protein [Lachnospiraceae bacterium]
MEYNGKDRIKEEDRKALGRFLLFVIVMSLAGCIVGFIIGVCHKKGISFTFEGKGFLNALAYAMPACIFLFNAVVFFVLHHICRKTKELCKACDGEDEVQLAQIESGMNHCQFITEISLVLNLFLLGVGQHVILAKMELLTIPEIHWRWLSGSITVCFFAGMAVSLFYKKNALNLYKQMNPEKQGSIYDLHFAAKWEESCDEREKLILYKAGYKAFYFGQVICIALAVISICCDLAFETGILPLVMVVAILLSMDVIYLCTGSRLEKSS